MCACLLARRAYLSISVADAFVLAFALGFGTELLGAAFAASIAQEPLKSLSWLPPSTLDNGVYTVSLR